MRISDWSSYACSSDLNLPKKVVHVNVDNAYGEAVYEYGLKDYMKQAGIDYSVIKYKAGELDLKPIMTRAKDAEPQVVIMTAGDDNDATQLIKAAKEASLSPEMFVGRSEEHPSELQSLMRLSYPVFCLKHTNPHH